MDATVGAVPTGCGCTGIGTRAQFLQVPRNAVNESRPQRRRAWDRRAGLDGPRGASMRELGWVRGTQRAGARRDAGARNIRARRPCSPDFRHLACRRYGARRSRRTRRTRRSKRASHVGERTRLAVVPASRGRCHSHPCLFLRVLHDLRASSFLRTTRRTSSMEIRVTSVVSAQPNASSILIPHPRR